MNFVPYDKVDLDIFSKANFLARRSVDIDCTTEQLMQGLAGDAIWADWVGPLEKVEWTSEKPYGHGARRTVYLKGGDAVKEYFFHWVEGERIAFYVEEGTLKGVQVFAEDYQIEALEGGRTRLSWTVALQMSGIQGVLAPVLALFARIAMKGWLNKLKAILETGSELQLDSQKT